MPLFLAGQSFTEPNRRRAVTPAAVAAGAFDPTTYGGGSCVLWLDPTDASTFTFSSSTVVSQWGDKSSSARHMAQGTVANQPNRNGTHNGLTTVTFDGSNDYLTRASNEQWTDVSAGTWTSVALYIPVSLTGTRAVMDCDNQSSGARVAQNLRTNSATTEAIAFNTAGSPFTDAAANLSSTVAYILMAVRRATDIELYVNGATTGATASTGTPRAVTCRMAIGSRNIGNDNFASGEIGDAIHYNTDLSTSDLNALGNALATRWNVSWSTI